MQSQQPPKTPDDPSRNTADDNSVTNNGESAGPGAPAGAAFAGASANTTAGAGANAGAPGETVRPLLSPEEIAVRAGQQVPYLHVPQRLELFALREQRMRHLAGPAEKPHPMRDFLLFNAELARAQHQALQSFGTDFPAVPLPTPAALDAASELGMPPLPATDWPRDPAWRAQLRRMSGRLAARLTETGSPALAAVQTVQQADDVWLEQQADRLLGSIMFGLDLATAPLIAAGLQVYWTHLVLATVAARDGDVAARLPPFGRTRDATACPCCASRPTASVSRVDASGSGYRYLHCSLCATQWHMVRVKCARCESTKGIHYQSLAAVARKVSFAGATAGATLESPVAPKPAIEAETCDECGHYLKLVRMDRELAIEPVADDLASVTLDLLVSDAGFERHGVNLMLLFGDPESADGDASAAPASGPAPARDAPAGPSFHEPGSLH